MVNNSYQEYRTKGFPVFFLLLVFLVNIPFLGGCLYYKTFDMHVVDEQGDQLMR